MLLSLLLFSFYFWSILSFHLPRNVTSDRNVAITLSSTTTQQNVLLCIKEAANTTFYSMFLKIEVAKTHGLQLLEGLTLVLMKESIQSHYLSEEHIQKLSPSSNVQGYVYAIICDSRIVNTI